MGCFFFTQKTVFPVNTGIPPVMKPHFATVYMCLILYNKALDSEYPFFSLLSTHL